MEIKERSIAQKFQIMEAIWQDFSERFERMEIQREHRDILDQRRARVDAGEAQLLDWDAVKSMIGRA